MCSTGTVYGTGRALAQVGMRAGPRMDAAEYLLGATPGQLATWVLYSFAYVKLDLEAGQSFPLFYTELEQKTGNNSYSLTWDGAILHGALAVDAGRVMVWAGQQAGAELSRGCACHPLSTPCSAAAAADAAAAGSHRLVRQQPCRLQAARRPCAMCWQQPG